MENISKLAVANLMIAGFTEMVEERVREGWTVEHFNVQFRQLRGGSAEVARQMRQEVERLYEMSLCHVVRKPRSLPQDALPLWICSPDYPVYKKQRREHLRLLVANDGRHMHVIAVLPPWSRLKTTLVDHLMAPSYEFDDERAAKYLGDKIFVIQGTPVETDHARVTDYAVKGIKTRRVELDDVFVLPRSRSELPGRTEGRATARLRREERQTRNDGQHGLSPKPDEPEAHSSRHR